MKKRVLFIALMALCLGKARADEGMWLMQLAQHQHLEDSLKKAGAKVSLTDIYSETRPSLKDAVGIFGQGCTGEIVSQKGLVFTNNHCGLSWANAVSTTERNIVKDGFFAKSYDEEIRIKGLTFTFVRKVVDVTDIVLKEAKKKKVCDYRMQMNSFLDKIAKKLQEKSEFAKQKGIRTRLLPFYRGKQFYMFYEQVYNDVRLVSNLPMNVGQFGGGQDNWTWPRQNCDFAAFRVYADADGQPAAYSKSNKPLECSKYLKISTDGVAKGDFTMIMGFPGRTSRYLSYPAVKYRTDVTNDSRIIPGNKRLTIWKNAMDKDGETYLKYLDKYFSLQNVVKNSEGMNLAVLRNHVLDSRKDEERKFAAFSKNHKNPKYDNVVEQLYGMYSQLKDSLFSYQLFENSIMKIENGCPYVLMDMYVEAFKSGDAAKITDIKNRLNKRYAYFHNDNYDAATDFEVAKAMIELFPRHNKISATPDFYSVIEKTYDGNIDAYLNDVYYKSICSNRENFDAFLSNPLAKPLSDDPGYSFSKSRSMYNSQFRNFISEFTEDFEKLNIAYAQGLYEMYDGMKSPDANFTMRMTYGHVSDLKPRDAVAYDYYTTLEGMFEKENPSDSDYVVNEELRKLFLTKEYGAYADKDGRLHTCFLSDNDITGGNSGSPVLNAKGELIGLAFDGNFESLSSDLEFAPKVQRCVNVDIRYVLFILDKFGNQAYLIDELNNKN